MSSIPKTVIRHVCTSIGGLLVVTSCAYQATTSDAHISSSFVSLSTVEASIQLDIRYATANNFVGRPIKGYLAPVCILTREAAVALARAQTLAIARGYSLKVYDCYRPQGAVSDFVDWARNDRDTVMQHRFYPGIPKSKLFKLGFIAEKSGHSRGSTVDLTLVPAGSQQPQADPLRPRYDCREDASQRFPDNSIDMGTGYDCFDVLAHTDNSHIGTSARQNRDQLRTIMRNAGFVNYDKEWWHYTLEKEPYPDTYFDFVVQ